VNGNVNAIAVSGSDIYVGGFFNTAGGVPVSNIAKWDGNSWSALGSGVNSSVNALAVSGDDVYAGGNFTTAGGQSASRVAKWNITASSWSALGNGVPDVVNAVAVSGSDVYVGGRFSVVNAMLANFIAKWNGSNWSTLGSGLSYYVNAAAVSGGEVYVGGEFMAAGGKPSWYFALWHTGTTDVEENGPQIPYEYTLSQNHPNPFNPSTTIRYALPNAGYVTLKVYNLAGAEIETLVSANQPAGQHTIRWNAVGLPSGVYFYRLQIGEAAATRKLILLR
jgi:hypothetical protein